MQTVTSGKVWRQGFRPEGGVGPGFDSCADAPNASAAKTTTTKVELPATAAGPLPSPEKALFLEAAPPGWRGLASPKRIGVANGKAEPFRTGKRPSRKNESNDDTIESFPNLSRRPNSFTGFSFSGSCSSPLLSLRFAVASPQRA